MLKFLLIASSVGHSKFSHYFVFTPFEKRPAIEARVIELCITQDKNACHFVEDEDQMVIYQWFGPYILIAASDLQENELLVAEFLNLFVNTLQKYFGKFSEKHILSHNDKLHMVLEEMVVNGEIVESNASNILSPLLMFDTAN